MYDPEKFIEESLLPFLRGIEKCAHEQASEATKTGDASEVVLYTTVAQSIDGIIQYIEANMKMWKKLN